MTATDARRDRVAKRISASQERLTRDGAKLPARTRRDPLPDATPPENYRSLAREYPLLTVAAGLGIGLLVAALLPRGFASKAGRRAMGAATVAAELGLAYSKQARDVAGEAAHDGIVKLEETTAPLRKNARRAGEGARNRGMQLAEDAMKLVNRLRK